MAQLSAEATGSPASCAGHKGRKELETGAIVVLWAETMYVLAVYLGACGFQEGWTGALLGGLELALLGILAVERWRSAVDASKWGTDWVLIGTSAAQVTGRLLGCTGVEGLELAALGTMLTSGYRLRVAADEWRKQQKQLTEQLQGLIALPESLQRPEIHKGLLACIEAVRTTTAPVHPSTKQELSNGLNGHFASTPSELAVFSTVKSMEFNIFTLQESTHNHTLHSLGQYLLLHSGLCTSQQIPLSQMNELLIALEAAYFPLPYHSSTHAADVLQAVHAFVRGELTEREEMVLYLAAAAHDVGHPGRNNVFLVNTGNQLAVLYNDKAVLENHHVSTLFRLMNEEKNAIFAKFPRSDYTQIRSTLINMILSTDISDHSRLLAAVQATPFPPSDPNQLRTLHLAFILHAGDISNPTRSWSLAHAWTQLILEECFLQGDEEQRLNLPIGPLNDRNLNIAKCQVGFIEHLVEPTFKALREVLPATEGLRETLAENKEAWKQKE